MENIDYTSGKKKLFYQINEGNLGLSCTAVRICLKKNGSGDQVKLESSCTPGLKSLSKYNSTKLTENPFVLIPVVLILQLIICFLNLK